VKTIKLREFKKEELSDRLFLKRKELADAKYEMYTGKANTVSDIRNLKKEIARIETVIKESSYTK
jgi:ribosomal protein L29